MAIKPTYVELGQRIKVLESHLEQMEETLRVSVERNRLATSAAKVGVWDWDIKTGDFYLDPNIKAILGYTDDEIPNDVEIWVKYVHPEDSKAVMEAAQACLDGKTSEYIFEHRMLHKDGSNRWILVRGKAIRDESGNAVRLIGTDADITDRKRAAEALQDSEAALAKAQKIAHIGSWNWDIVANRISWSDELYRIIGLSPQEFDANYESYLKCIHPDNLEFFKNLTERVLKEKKPYSAEYRIVRSKNDIRIVHEIGEVTVDENGNPISLFGTVQDITDSKQTEEALRESEEKLARAKKMEALGLLAGGVAHDLNNVLSGIVSYPELLLMDLPQNSKLREPIETIQRSGHRAVAIVQDLLTAARGVATAKEPLNLNDIVSDYLNSPEFKKLEHFHPTVTVKTDDKEGMTAIYQRP